MKLSGIGENGKAATFGQEALIIEFPLKGINYPRNCQGVIEVGRKKGVAVLGGDWWSYNSKILKDGKPFTEAWIEERSEDHSIRFGNLPYGDYTVHIFLEGDHPIVPKVKVIYD